MTFVALHQCRVSKVVADRELADLAVFWLSHVVTGVASLNSMAFPDASFVVTRSDCETAPRHCPTNHRRAIAR